MTMGSQNRVAVLHGANLDQLGGRDPEQYGTLTLRELEVQVRRWAHELGLETIFYQTNSEGEFIEHLHRAPELADAVIVNAGAWTHYSYGIRDALAILTAPVVEIHMSNIHAREEFRHHSVFGEIVKGQICGFGLDSYLLGLRAAVSASAAA